MVDQPSATTTATTPAPLTPYGEQLALEREMVDNGVANFLAAVRTATEKGEASRAGGFHSLTRRMVDPLSEAIDTYILTQTHGDQRVRNRLAAVGDAKVAAFLAIKETVDTLALRGKVQLQRLAVLLGRTLEFETRLRAFSAQHNDKYGWLLNDLKKNKQSRAHRKKVMTFAMTKFGFDPLSWPEEERALVGVKLLSWFSELSGCIEIKLVDENNKGRYVVTFAPEALNDIKEIDALAGLGSPRRLPCIVPPKDWTTPFDGGYHSHDLRRRHPIVKAHNRGLSQAYLMEMRDRGPQLSQVYEAVNALQRTAWRVNDKVLAVLQQFWKNGVAVAGLPEVRPEEVPVKPHDIATNEEARRAWRKRAHAVHTRNAANKSKRIQVMQAISAADRFAQYPAIYFPYQLDFRGRCYALPYFNPQGADWVKALLTFATAKPINDACSRGWLAIHGANCFGEVDKESLDARIKWVAANEAKIIAASEDPYSNRWWTEADKPWCFLAWCFEWAGLRHAEDIGEPYLSGLPVALDGSCSGLQHYSAILRDARGGLSTNLVPAPKPNDIYADVAKTVLDMLHAVPVDHESHTIAQAWINSGLVDRKLTKRSVMIVPYSGTLSACRKYVFERLAEVKHPFGDDLWPHVKLISELIWKAIEQVVTSARQGMRFLKQSAGLLAKDGLPVSWTTPVGFPVVQCYPNLKPYRIETKIGDKLLMSSTRVQLVLVEETGEIDADAQRLGIAPNFIHSMDAAALMAYVLIAKDNGIGSFGVIHDSFATHAADTEMSAQCLRHAFVDMYETNDVLTQFKADCAKALPPDKAAKLPGIPQRGSLSLASVIDSDYFFA